MYGATEGSATAYEILKSDEYNKDFRISKERFPDFRWDFRIAQALAGISDYRHKFREISGFPSKILIACDF